MLGLFPVLFRRQPGRGQRPAVSQSAAATFLLQSGAAMGYLKERWTEDEVLDLPDGEHHYFERKSGRLWADRHDLFSKLAKAVSAFANSGGGHIVLGQADDGTIDGVPEVERRTPVREWLEQKLPTLVAYPLENFRVHAAIPSTPTRIQAGKALVVIDVGDSRLAPHQACFPADAPQYYYRQGGKSVLAPHHYLEALRNRLTFAVLEPRLEWVKARGTLRQSSGHVVVELVFRFEVKNVSRVACHRWDVALTIHPDAEERLEDYLVDQDRFPPLGPNGIQIPGDETVLPTRTKRKDIFVGLRIDTARPAIDQVERFLTWEARYSAISENHIGAEHVVKLSEVADRNIIYLDVKNLN